MMKQGSLPSKIASLCLVQGPGYPKSNTACIMSAARILAGEASIEDSRIDDCARVCRMIRSYAILINDWRGWCDDDERTKYLLPLTPLVLDTRTENTRIMQRRAYVAVNSVIRRITPLALEAEKRPECAAVLRALAPIVDRQSAIRAGNAAYDVRNFVASEAAYAAAKAANAAYGTAVIAAANTAGFLAHSNSDTRKLVRDEIVATLRVMCKVRA